MSVHQTLTPHALREALGCFATGVAVVTGLHPEHGAVGLTISSFNSVSLSPPLVLWSLAAHSPSRAAFAPGRPFAVNVLSARQEDLCRHFARPSAAKFASLPIETGLDDVPLLPGTVARFECVTERAIEAGDHQLYIGRVRHAGVNTSAPPLIFHRSRLSALVEGRAA
ncbi:MAG: flavin reductase family protein [Rhodobacteraceae bacterium]|nr:flavin reductase family protein [Paracoccaceae bacterium]